MSSSIVTDWQSYPALESVVRLEVDATWFSYWGERDQSNFILHWFPTWALDEDENVVTKSSCYRHDKPGNAQRSAQWKACGELRQDACMFFCDDCRRAYYVSNSWTKQNNT